MKKILAKNFINAFAHRSFAYGFEVALSVVGARLAPAPPPALGVPTTAKAYRFFNHIFGVCGRRELYVYGFEFRNSSFRLPNRYINVKSGIIANLLRTYFERVKTRPFTLSIRWETEGARRSASEEGSQLTLWLSKRYRTSCEAIASLKFFARLPFKKAA